MIKQTEILVIGGGPAGLSAACAAAELEPASSYVSAITSPAVS